MDLAEIRKKAQQEQERQNGTQGTDPQICADHSESLDRILEWPSQEEVPDYPVVNPSRRIETVTPPVRQQASVSNIVDPLAIILAGRKAAACDLSASEENDAESGTANDKKLELLCFRVAQEEYAINILDIKEIIKPREVTEVPRVPSFISGVISLRGIITPILNMHERLSLPLPPVTGRERVVVVRTGNDLFGICVDEVNQVARIDSTTLEPTPAVLEGINREFVSGIGRFDGRMLILLNLEKLLDVSLC
jgi:purine-binding chemotaxis protein CheW